MYLGRRLMTIRLNILHLSCSPSEYVPGDLIDVAMVVSAEQYTMLMFLEEFEDNRLYAKLLKSDLPRRYTSFLVHVPIGEEI